MREPEAAERLKALYVEPNPGTATGFAAFMRTELTKWTPVIKRSGTTVD